MRQKWARKSLTTNHLPIALAAVLCGWLGPVVERALFNGDIKRWLAWGREQPGMGDTVGFENATGGWVLLLLPL